MTKKSTTQIQKMNNSFFSHAVDQESKSSPLWESREENQDTAVWMCMKCVEKREVERSVKL
jgi:hypothetical protein